MSAPTPPRGQARGRYRAYGVELACDFPLPASLPATGTGAGPTICVESTTAAAVHEGWETIYTLHEATLDDGGELRVERGRAGEHLIRRGEHCFRLSGDLRRMVCAPPAAPDPDWESSLLDWAPYAAAVLAKTECLHAGAVEIDGRVIAIAAPSGGGKSTLVAALIGAGARFFSDDVVAIEAGGGEVVAHPGAPFSRLPRAERGLAAAIGTVRDEVGDELWIEAADPATEAAPLAGLIVLDRRPDGPPSPCFEPVRFAVLRALSIGFPGAGGGEARRLALLAELTARATVVRLEANAAVPPERLAEAVLDRLGEGR